MNLQNFFPPDTVNITDPISKDLLYQQNPTIQLLGSLFKCVFISTIALFIPELSFHSTHFTFKISIHLRFYTFKIHIQIKLFILYPNHKELPNTLPWKHPTHPKIFHQALAAMCGSLLS